MQMHRIRNISKVFQLLVAAAILLSSAPAWATEELRQPRRGDEVLLDAHTRFEAKLEKNSFGFPLFLESSEKDNRVHVDVYGILDHSFISVLTMLKVPANWCDIVSLHPNVKVCTYREQPGAWLLTFYVGRKTYQPPEKARKVIYHYRTVEQQPGYLDVLLNADEGPYGTKDHRMRFEAVPLEGGKKTFVHVSYAYSGSASLRLAETLYFATLGWGKMGFTVTGTDGKGNPVYVGGSRAALERNAVRYYFAIQSFMDALHSTEENRFSMRLGAWYDFTDKHRKQLYEMEKKDYLATKTMERKDQIILQQLIGTGHP